MCGSPIHQFFCCWCFLTYNSWNCRCQDPGDPGTKLATGTRSLCSTDSAIAALFLDGGVQVWGDAMNGGNLEEVPSVGGKPGLKQMECWGRCRRFVQTLT